MHRISTIKPHMAVEIRKPHTSKYTSKVSVLKLIQLKFWQTVFTQLDKLTWHKSDTMPEIFFSMWSLFSSIFSRISWLTCWSLDGLSTYRPLNASRHFFWSVLRRIVRMTKVVIVVPMGKEDHFSNNALRSMILPWNGYRSQ